MIRDDNMTWLDANEGKHKRSPQNLLQTRRGKDFWGVWIQWWPDVSLVNTQTKCSIFMHFSSDVQQKRWRFSFCSSTKKDLHQQGFHPSLSSLWLSCSVLGFTPRSPSFSNEDIHLKNWFTDICLGRDQCIENVIQWYIYWVLYSAVDEFLQHQLKIQLIHRNEVTCCVFNLFW